MNDTNTSVSDINLDSSLVGEKNKNVSFCAINVIIDNNNLVSKNKDKSFENNDTIMSVNVVPKLSIQSNSNFLDAESLDRELVARNSNSPIFNNFEVNNSEFHNLSQSSVLSNFLKQSC